jgi:hypothetical protein
MKKIKKSESNMLVELTHCESNDEYKRRRKCRCSESNMLVELTHCESNEEINEDNSIK